MIPVETMLDQFRDSLTWIEEAIAGVPTDRVAEQPAGVPNHPAWTMTHLCVALDFTLPMLGLPQQCPPGWAKVGHPGSKPLADRSVYPTLAESIQTFRDLHAAVDAAVRKADAATFAKPAPDEIRAFAPTVGHVMAYMLLSHENYHLAQLLTWKRAAGLMKND